jgi:hypothetical protein
MEADWPAGESTGWHSHPRGQLLYAIEGVMIVELAAGSWVIPPSRALWLVPGVRHNVTMSGDLNMRTAYIDILRVGDLPDDTRVISVSALLREVLVAARKLRPATREAPALITPAPPPRPAPP